MEGGEGQPCLYFVYSVAVVDSCYNGFNEDVLAFKEKGTVVLLGDFNARVGRSDDVVGVFGEDTCNVSRNPFE